MKTKTVSAKYFLSALALGTAFISASTNAADSPTNVAPDTILFHDRPEIRTPAAPPAPRINGPSIFGVRPEHPFLYHIPATGDRPMAFSVKNLPPGLKVDAESGDITGSLQKPGEYTMTLRAQNGKGADHVAEKKFKIVVGETIALTPPLGWNS
jgi:alpha-galactosidase